MYLQLVELAARFPLILGSGSPRRVELLRECGVKFTQIIPDIHEKLHPDESPFPYAQRLAEQKAMVVSGQAPADAVVLGCDTIVVLGDEVLEKPDDGAHARAMLLRLSARQHTVCTACAFARCGQLLASGYELTDVYFNPLSPERIDEYIATGEPMDKAGSYGIQGMGGFLVDRIAGNLDTVVGLPRTLLDHLAGDVLRH